MHATATSWLPARLNAVAAAQTAQWQDAAHLIRSTGFGATGTAVDAVVRTGTDAYVRSILAADASADAGARRTPLPTYPYVAPVGRNATSQQRAAHNAELRSHLLDLTAWWVQRMVAVEQPFGEKLTFCWHNHFATAATKVRQAGWLAAQNEKLRTLGRGDFRTLALAMLGDAAMLFWLDGEKNTASAPNENLAREFMELFALGHGDGYTETDVREGARALTGWRIRSDGSTDVVARLHDTGSKTVLGVTGNLDAAGFCDAVLARPSSPLYLAGRWWGQLASDAVIPPAVATAAAGAYGPQHSLVPMFTTLLTRPEFSAARASRVIGPLEWLVGVVRALHVPVADRAAATKLLATLRSLGQVPFYPPNVGGWPSGQAWLSTAAADTRLRAAATLAQQGDLSTITKASSGNRAEALGYLLGVGGWSARTSAALQPVLADPVRLVAVAVNSPEYLVN